MMCQEIPQGRIFQVLLHTKGDSVSGNFFSTGNISFIIYYSYGKDLC